MSHSCPNCNAAVEEALDWICWECGWEIGFTCWFCEQFNTGIINECQFCGCSH